MVRRKLILGFLETPNGVQWVDVDQKSIRYSDKLAETIEMKYVAGMKRWGAKSLPDKSFSTLHVPEEQLFFWPTGKENGHINTERTTFIFGLCKHVEPKKLNEIVEMKVDNIRYKKEVCKLGDRIKELEEELKKVQQQMSMLK